MTITINWGTSVINVPKADLTLIQLTPTEIRELNLNDFRLILKDLEDSLEGIPFMKTHNHNTTVDVGGVTLARVINLLAPYTVTFEDAQYAVNLVGANSNVGDRVNVNQVSVRSANSAGLVTSKGIEAIEYRGGVTIDIINGVSGTVYPTGTLRRPVNNLTDAVIIAHAKGFKKLYILESMTIDSGTDISDFTIIGASHVNTHIIMHDSAICHDITIENCNVSGTLDGGTYIVDCSVGSLNYVNGHICNCGMYGTVILGGNEKCVIANCFTIDQDNSLIIDMGGTGQSLAAPNYCGFVTITNLSSSIEEIAIGLNGGRVELTNNITAGTITVSGVGELIWTQTGTEIIDKDGLMNVKTITKPSWNILYVDTINGESGTVFPIGTANRPSDNFADAISIANAHNINHFHVHGNLVVTGDATDKTFVSNTANETIINFNGQNINNSTFIGLDIIGNGSGHFSANDCKMESGMTGIEAYLENCILMGTFIVAIGKTLNMDRCTSKTLATINLNGTGSLGSANSSGIFTITNATDVGCRIGITGTYLLTLDASCIAGMVFLAGIGIFINNSLMTVTDRTVPSSTWDEPTTEHNNAGTFGKMIQDTETYIIRLLGLHHENYVMDTIVYSGTLMTSAKLRLYNDNTLTTEIATYTVTVVYDGDNVLSHTVVKD